MLVPTDQQFSLRAFLDGFRLMRKKSCRAPSRTRTSPDLRTSSPKDRLSPVNPNSAQRIMLSSHERIYPSNLLHTVSATRPAALEAVGK